MPRKRIKKIKSYELAELTLALDNEKLVSSKQWGKMIDLMWELKAAERALDAKQDEVAAYLLSTPLDKYTSRLLSSLNLQKG